MSEVLDVTMCGPLDAAVVSRGVGVEPLPLLALEGRPLIGLAGLARVGKDTAARHLMVQHGLSVYAFADPIKRALCAMFSFPRSHFDGDQKEVVIPWIGQSPRRLMQTLGTEWGRELVASDLWTRICAKDVEFDIEIRDGYAVDGLGDDPWRGGVVSDVRFENEADWIREQGGVVVHILRTDARLVAGHKSEAGVRRVLGDIAIVNNGTEAELFDRLDGLMAALQEVR